MAGQGIISKETVGIMCLDELTGENTEEGGCVGCPGVWGRNTAGKGENQGKYKGCLDGGPR
jgi:hypothetical protein